MVTRFTFSKSFQVLYQAFGKYKRRILFLALLGFVGGLFEGLSIGAIIPLFSFIVGSKDAGQGSAVSRFIEQAFSYLPFEPSVLSLLSLIVGLFIAKAVVFMVFGRLRLRIVVDFRNEMLESIFSKVLTARWPFLLRQKLGHLQSVFLRDVAQSSALLTHVSYLILSFSTMLIYFGIAMNLMPSITLLTIATGGLAFAAARPLARKAKLVAREMASAEKDAAQHLGEHIIGMKAVKTSAVEDQVFRKGAEYFGKFRELSIKSFLLRSWSSSFIQPGSLVFISILFYISYQSPDFNIAKFIATIYLIHRIFVDVETAQKSLQSIADLLPYTADAIELRNTLSEHEEKSEGDELFSFRDEILFRNVGFSYNSDSEVLQNVNIRIRRGETVGVIGPSGAGKTSLVDLLLRLFIPQKGSIAVDGKNIDTISLRSWRSKIGYVSQDIFLLHDTIERNIAFYKENISHAEVVEAAKQANIYEFIQKQKDGFNTVVGDRGIMLSAGQRQRIVLARELARAPDILVLDEATSALDNESEVLIQKALMALRGKMTVVMIAHRLSTVLDVDRIFVLDRGTIVEEGRPDALLQNKDSYFNKMYHLKDSV